MKIETAIKYFENEIRFCERAPALNGCEMTGDWMLTMEASKLAVEALREKQEHMNPKPLTEEELRGMIGEPVWVAYNYGGGYWAIMSRTLLGLSNGFTAYRSKPVDHLREVAKMEEVQSDG